MDIICLNNNITVKKEVKVNFLNITKDYSDEIRDEKNIIGIKRIDSFDCNSSIHTFDPNKSSPPKKFFIKGSLRLDNY
tara:strand:- start:346 stop:579 length:234 start_codon:yes stop_codon:yes gene_type:complete